MVHKTGQVKKVHMGRLPKGSDLLKGITEFCEQNGIGAGKVEAIGAVTKAAVGYYQQDKWEYITMEFSQPMEIISLVGNISHKDGKPFIHAHIGLMDENGAMFGGHLVEGNTIFACEFTVTEFEGIELHRSYDEETGLQLWPFEK